MSDTAEPGGTAAMRDDLVVVPDTIDLRNRTGRPSDSAESISWDGLPTITVLVPTLNEEAGLPGLLEDLAEQTYRASEILIIDGGSDDRTRELVEEATNLPIAVLDNPAKRVPQALNIGLARSSSDIIVRIDGHARVNSSYLETITRNFILYPELGGVGGVKRAVATTPTGRTIAKVLSSRFGVGGSRYHYATEAMAVDHIPFGAYPRAILNELGGWDETFVVNQDYELDYRVRRSGRGLLLDPSAQIDWSSRETIPRLAHQYLRYGQGKALVVSRHPASAKPRHLLPAVIVIGLGSAAVVALATRSLWPMAAFPAYMGLAGLLAALVDGVRPRSWPTATAAVMSMQLAYGVGLVRGFTAKLLGRTLRITSSQTSSLSRPGT